MEIYLSYGGFNRSIKGLLALLLRLGIKYIARGIDARLSGDVS